MSSLLPVAVYGLEVPPGEIMVPAEIEFPATIRITMAAIDPTAEPQTDGQGNVPSVPRSTLKIYKASVDDEDEEDDEYLQQLLGGADDESSDDDEEVNGGPSDPSKSKKARRDAAIKKLMEATKEDSDAEMEDAEKPNGKNKGKAKASDEDDESSDEEEEADFHMDEFVVCTLDTERTYQQPIDITVGEGEKIFFSVKGTHTVYLTGNYVVPQDEEEDDEDEDEDEYSDDDLEYDLPPGLEDEDSDEMSDELDHIDGATRVEEIDTDDEEAPKLVEAKKGKKRPAEENAENLDDMMAKDDKKLSKKQQKKLKNNQGEAVAAAADKKEAKSDKKVQFAKNLEQGPTGPAKDKLENKADKGDKKGLGVKVVQGVTVDDRKVGTGRTAKAGDRVSMRYIGKLENGKVFDANKKGAPFSFKLGKGEVIKGWDIGIVGMAVGGERRLTIPAHLAYGSRSMPGIPANSKLIFDVKLLEIK
ncbi:hypothetical protein VTJ83DRAFT_250 [Remersonia thermophila]|uniref:FK506-binding protein n=1 Tax=Remersonia thermophila TaxID=72144 RepID=A0ABR4DKK0_9PEZI